METNVLNESFLTWSRTSGGTQLISINLSTRSGKRAAMAQAIIGN